MLRDLFAGPKRFTDLASGLPGIGSAVLAERLRGLEQHGVVARRQLGPPAPALLYQLTPRGLALEPVLAGLARWGAAYLAVGDDLDRRGRWLLQAMAATAGAAPARIETVNFILDGEVTHVRAIRDGRLAAVDGSSPDARITVRGTVHDLYRLTAASEEPAASSRAFHVEGDRKVAQRLLDRLVSGFRHAVESGGTGRELG